MALARINAALARLEAAASRPADSNGELEARHQHLRTAVTQALGQLDDLIAGQQR